MYCMHLMICILNERTSTSTEFRIIIKNIRIMIKKTHRLIIIVLLRDLGKSTQKALPGSNSCLILPVPATLRVISPRYDNQVNSQISPEIFKKQLQGITYLFYSIWAFVTRGMH